MPWLKILTSGGLPVFIQSELIEAIRPHETQGQPSQCTLDMHSGESHLARHRAEDVIETAVDPHATTIHPRVVPAAPCYVREPLEVNPNNTGFSARDAQHAATGDEAYDRAPEPALRPGEGAR